MGNGKGAGTDRRDAVGDARHEADIVITEHGVVHVTAADWGSLGFGQGWGCARDNAAVIADQVTKARGERARYWGRGSGDHHVAGDFGYRVLDLVGRAEALRNAQPDWIRNLVDGYRAGYNRALAEMTPEDLPRWARGADWVRPLDELDLWVHIGDVALMASGRNLVQLIGRAEAPGPDGPAPPSPADALGPPPAASNGWALSGALSESGGGMVLANPHFPWYGEARFWECHLRIPGTYDVYGVSLLGTPGIQMGFNSSLGWAHTFSRGHRFTVAGLELDPADPTRYRHGDRVLDMEPTTHSVDVRLDDGSTGEAERTLWRSHHGPMLNMPLIGWGNDTGFTFRDANEGNHRVLEQFLAMGMASDVHEMRKVFHEVRGMPWVNTMAADSGGAAWYTDGSATPRLTSGAAERFRARIGDDLIAGLLFENRIALLDGSDPDDDWQDHPEARSPGIEPPSALPELRGCDIVVNANDSHWLNSPGHPLEGHSVLGGLERTARSLRTRKNLQAAAALAERGAVTLDDLLEAVFDNESLSAEMLCADVVQRCRGAVEAGKGRIVVEGHEGDLAAAADVLEAWDGRFNLDSRGAVLWREFMAGFPESAWLGAGPLFATDFDPEDPLNTPRDLAPPPESGEDPVTRSMGHAMRVLAAAGIALDAPLGDVQWADRGERRVPVHGGGEGEGMLNVLAPSGALPPSSLDPMPASPVQVPGRERTGLVEGGYRVTYGTSFLMALEFRANGPRALGLMAYGQSSNEDSPRHVDGTLAYSAREPRPLRFSDAEINASPELQRLRLLA